MLHTELKSKIKSTMPHSNLNLKNSQFLIAQRNKSFSGVGVCEGARALDASSFHQKKTAAQRIVTFQQFSCAQGTNSIINPQDLKNLDGHQEPKFLRDGVFVKFLDIRKLWDKFWSGGIVT